MTPLASGLIPFPCQYGHMGVVSKAHGGGVEIPILSHEFRRRVWGPWMAASCAEDDILALWWTLICVEEKGDQ